MNSAILNVKIDTKTKKEAQKKAHELGLSLSDIVRGIILHFVKTETVIFTLDKKLQREYVRSFIRLAQTQKQKSTNPAPR